MVADPAADRYLRLFYFGGFFLLTEHTAHVFGELPYLLLAACPLMHLFMHHGRHGGHDRVPRLRPDKELEGRS